MVLSSNGNLWRNPHVWLWRNITTGISVKPSSQNHIKILYTSYHWLLATRRQGLISPCYVPYRLARIHDEDLNSWVRLDDGLHNISWLKPSPILKFWTLQICHTQDRFMCRFAEIMLPTRNVKTVNEEKKNRRLWRKRFMPTHQSVIFALLLSSNAHSNIWFISPLLSISNRRPQQASNQQKVTKASCNASFLVG